MFERTNTKLKIDIYAAIDKTTMKIFSMLNLKY